MAKTKPKVRRQVAALPVQRRPDGVLQVLLITSRETNRFIVPKGWPLRGRKNHHTAAIEAREEAGIIGRVRRKPLGTFSYWKRFADHFELCRVKVFILEVERTLASWAEKGQRRSAWLFVDDAAMLVDDPGLSVLIRKLPKRVRAPSSIVTSRDKPA